MRYKNTFYIVDVIDCYKLNLIKKRGEECGKEKQLVECK
jgi:hypothetical protein